MGTTLPIWERSKRSICGKHFAHVLEPVLVIAQEMPLMPPRHWEGMGKKWGRGGGIRTAFLSSHGPFQVANSSKSRLMVCMPPAGVDRTKGMPDRF